jgi:type I restriction enzyme S subunit
MKAGWKKRNLGELCEVFADGDWIETKDQSADGIRLIQTGNVGEGAFKDRAEKARYISEETFRRLRCTEIFKGDCLISRLPEPVGRSAILPDTGERMITSVDCTIVRFDQKLCLPTFFSYYSQSTDYLTTIAKVCTGTTRTRISRSNLALTPIPVPPLPEQRRIAAILDEAFEAIATAKANAEKNLQNAKDLFESHLKSVFTERGEGWVDRTLDKVCIVERGSSPRPIKNYFTTAADGVNWIKIGDTEEGGKYVVSTAQKITLEGAKQSRYVKEGDFILTNSMSLGRPYIMKTDGYIHDGWFVLRLREGLDAEFFYYLLSSSYVQNQFHTLAAGSVVKNISGDLVKKAVLPIPPLDQQYNLAMRFAEFSEESRRLESICREKQTVLDDLKKSLLHQAFSGAL